jgi:hypothetical protein
MLNPAATQSRQRLESSIVHRAARGTKNGTLTLIAWDDGAPFLDQVVKLVAFRYARAPTPAIPSGRLHAPGTS